MSDLITDVTTKTDGPSADNARLVGLVRHLLVLGAAFVLWVWSINRVDQEAMGDFGLVTILPISTFVALGIAIAGFVISTRREHAGPLLATYVMSLAVMLHGMPTFAYDHLRFSWAWKHVGMVDYIQRFGDVDGGDGALAVYHNWPGFFGLNAWITDSSGLASALSYAAWAPILFNLLFVGALYLLFRSFSADQRLIWTAILVFVLGSWVGQDYFAPQALAFFMYLLLLAILLRWYSRPNVAGLAPQDDEPALDTATTYVLGTVMVLAMVMIATSHQLTPVITIAAIGALVAFRQLRVIWPLYTMIGITAAWFLGPAREFVLDNAANVVREFGGVQTNLDNTVVDFETVDSAQRTIALVSRLLSATIFALGGIGLLRRRARGERSGWLLLLTAVPAVMVFASSYGGEIILRAYLFALPFAAFLAASLWFPSREEGRGPQTQIMLGAALVVLMMGLVVADFGADQRQVFSDDEVAAAEYVVANADTGSLIIEGTRDYPRLHKDNEQHTYLTLDRLPDDALGRVLAAPADVLATWLGDDDRYTGGYVILTQSQQASVSTLGSSLVPTLTTIEDALRASELFDIGYESSGAVVFQLAGQS